MKRSDFDWQANTMRRCMAPLAGHTLTEALMMARLMPLVAPGAALRCGQTLRPNSKLNQDRLIAVGSEYIARQILPELKTRTASGDLTVRADLTWF